MRTVVVVGYVEGFEGAARTFQKRPLNDDATVQDWLQIEKLKLPTRKIRNVTYSNIDLEGFIKRSGVSRRVNGKKSWLCESCQREKFKNQQ